MSVIAFPRWRRTLADHNREATLRRARFAARHAGCDGADVLTVESYAAGLIEDGQAPDRVVQACTSFAHQLLARAPIPA